jgi:hypothetical protein
MIRTKIIKQSDLASHGLTGHQCWNITVFGLWACQRCEFKDDPEQCGGRDVRQLIREGRFPIHGVLDRRQQ